MGGWNRVAALSLRYPSLSRAQKYLFGIGKGELAALKSIVRGKPSHGFADVGRKHDSCSAFRLAGKYIALQDRRKPLVPGQFQRPSIRCLATIKRLADPVHFSRHRKVAYAHFPHAVIHVPAELIEELLPEGADGHCFTLQTPQNQHGMEHDHFQSAVNGVRHTIDLIEGGRACLCHDRAIETRDALVPRGTAKQLRYHQVSSAAGDRMQDQRKSDSAKGTNAPASMTMIWESWARMNRSTPRIAPFTVAAVMAVAMLLSGCFSETYQRGYIVPEGALEQIPIGSTQEQVLIVLGTPSTVATVSGEAFYYISQRAERPIGFMPQQVTDQRVIAVYFDKNRRVERLANYGLKDGKVFDFVSRATP